MLVCTYPELSLSALATFDLGTMHLSLPVVASQEVYLMKYGTSGSCKYTSACASLGICILLTTPVNLSRALHVLFLPMLTNLVGHSMHWHGRMCPTADTYWHPAVRYMQYERMGY